jgi:hypothetical protein
LNQAISTSISITGFGTGQFTQLVDTGIDQVGNVGALGILARLTLC